MIENKDDFKRVKRSSKSIDDLQKIIDHLESEMQEMKENHYYELKQLEHELNELKSRFITTVSHEFRTPLTTISFSAGLLENYSNKISEEKKHNHFLRIKQGIEQMTSLLEEVLIVSKLDSGDSEINFTPIDLEKLCSNLVEKMQQKFPNNPIFFTSSGGENKVKLDENLIKQMLKNILDNALKYSQERGQIQLELITENNQAVLKVKDQGIGIPQKDQERLFTHFHRGTNVGTISGTGLGLSIVKKIVDLHQGQISYESEENVGTKITIILPLKTCETVIIQNCD
ncbi:MAG: HAMP domain-containing sensor histidine kinase [Limnoraphis robusta]|uniref:sensor histidine kinase n=1 Tax=Limnoraphis robusta TaxID=1118279 RepID=UPI00066CA41E|nr:HAMP domain-containing sensor histidine kinase [Limnoraphis robusta]